MSDRADLTVPWLTASGVNSAANPAKLLRMARVRSYSLLPGELTLVDAGDAFQLYLGFCEKSWKGHGDSSSGTAPGESYDFRAALFSPAGALSDGNGLAQGPFEEKRYFDELDAIDFEELWAYQLGPLAGLLTAQICRERLAVLQAKCEHAFSTAAFNSGRSWGRPKRLAREACRQASGSLWKESPLS